MRFMFVTVLMLSLTACGSSVKDYSGATALTTINSDLNVKRLWVKEVGKLIRNHHAQLPPAVVGNVIYVADTSGKVNALSADRGTKLWGVNTKEILTGGPGVGQGLIVLGTRKAEIIALGLSNGAQRWRTRLGAEMLAVPQVVDGQVIVQTVDGKVIALHAETGKQVWSYSHAIPALTLRGTSTPLVLGERVLAGFADGKLVSLERKTGKMQWTTAIAVPHGRTDIERLVDIDGLFAGTSDTVYVTSFQGNIAAVSIANGETRWSREISSYTGLVIGDKQIFLSDAEGLIWALDMRNGGTLWRQDKLKGREPSVPVLMVNAIVVGDFDGYVHWLALDDGQIIARQSLEHLWRKATVLMPAEGDSKRRRRSISSTPLVMGKRFYVRDNLGALAAFEAGSRLSGQ